MSKKDEALKLALEALEEIHPGNMTPMAEGNWNKAIAAIREALADSALDRMAENERELGIQMQPAQQEEKPTTREEILSMAREAGVFETRYNPVAYSATPEALERFAALVAAHVRETEFKLREKNA